MDSKLIIGQNKGKIMIFCPRCGEPLKMKKNKNDDLYMADLDLLKKHENICKKRFTF